LNHTQERIYFAALPAPLADIVVLLVDTGLCLGEALSLDWAQVHLEPTNGPKFGYLTVFWKRKAVAREMSPSVNVPLPCSRIGSQRKRVGCFIGKLKMSDGFVLHSLRHTFGSGLGESGADAFTIMRLMGHSSVTVSQRYVHPSPEAVELAYERMTTLNLQQAATVSATGRGDA